MDYYRDPSHPFQLDRDRFPQNVAHDDNHPPNDHVDADPDAQVAGPTRYCSVRGCTSVLPLDYGNKMCDVCRSRHRIYASTKRAKRKMEKAALGSGWTPGGEDSPPENDGSPSSGNVLPAEETSSSEPTPYAFPGGSWESTTLDPRLFQPSSTSSELAGALTLPRSSSSRPRSPHSQVPALHPSSSILAENAAPGTPGSISAPAFPHFQRAESMQPHMAPPQPKEISVQSISEVAAIQPTGSLPPRFCSIKGCKAILDGSSLFKMCDSCRGKYKTYGTTKRKKWKEEKAKAIAEMERQREEQNKIRAEQGLPPLPNVNTLAWPEDNVTGRAVNTSIPRMCTVSHCRVILPVGYEYLRCERHRIQNRHHSKLKRVRDKDAKAQALEGFFATLTGSASPPGMYPMSQSFDDQEGPELFEEGSSGQDNQIPIAELYRMDEQKRAEVVDLNVVEPQVIIFGVPPAARGVRRTNHVCCIKGCHNLLSPATPWKMCDDCRAHERTVRKIRALRESGVMVEPLPPRMPPRERKEKVPKEKKPRPSKKDKATEGSESHSPENSPELEDDGDGSGIVFMDPILGEDARASEPTASNDNDVSFAMTSQEGSVPPQAVQSSETTSVDVAAAPKDPTASDTTPATSSAPKKKTKRKAVTKASAAGSSGHSGSAQPTASTSAIPIAPAPPSTAPAGYPPPPAGSAPAPYGVPYYLPPPGYGMPYAPGAPYPYGGPPPHPSAFPRDGFAPSPMYQPPYPGYAGYPPPHYAPYGYYPPPYATYPPPQGATSGSGTPSAGAPPPSSTAWFPPPPPDPSTMYSMFPVRLDAPRASESASAPPAPAPAPPPAAPSSSSATAAPVTAPATTTTTTASSSPGKQKDREVIWVDRPPEKRKRRKADMQAVEAYLKRREEEQVAPAEGAAEGAAEAGTAAAPASTASEGTGDGGAPDAVPSIAATHRACGNKLCSRMLPATEVGSICGRCKEKMKKRAMKVKKRFKLMPASSASKLAAKSTKHDVGAVDDIDADGEGDGEGDEDDGMEEVIVEGALIPATPAP